jgi:hypothetical protein
VTSKSPAFDADRLINHVDGVRHLRTAATSGPAFRPPVHNVSTKSHGVNDAGWGKLLTRPSELSGNLISRNIWEQVGGMDEGVKILHISICDMSSDI